MENIKQQFSDFEVGLHQKIETAFSSNDNATFFYALAENGKIITQQIVRLSDLAAKALMENEDEFSKNRLWLQVANFSWLQQMKAYTLLWRDIAFQTQKAFIRLWNEELSEEKFKQFKQKALLQLNIATEQITNFIDKQVVSLTAPRNGLENQITEWNLQDNPHLIYKQQLQSIGNQCYNLNQISQVLKKHFESFQKVNQIICSSLSDYEDIIKNQRQTATEIIELINENIATKAGKVAIQTKNIENKIEYSNHQEAFKLAFESELLNLNEKTSIPIDVFEGIIQTKDFNFRRRVKQWVEAEILPLMYEVWELMEFITDNLKMSLRNIQNRSTIIANDLKNDKATSIEDVDTPLQSFLNRTEGWEQEIKILDNLIRKRLKKSFKLSKVYDSKTEFLPVPLQSTLSQSWFAETKLYRQLMTFYTFLNNQVKHFRNTVEQETSLSTSEKIVRYVRAKEVLSDNSHYSSIFLTKGYIGEAFWIERTQQMQHIQELIEQWKLGYRGSVLLHGQRFSGKTLFGEMVANRFFANNVVRLAPKTIVHFNGRKHQTSYDLGDALDFVKKYNRNLQPMIWIDDLETWASPEHLITENIRRLKKFIDNHSNNIFVMISISNWAKAHLNSIYELDKVFQADFNLDKMNIEEVQRAILVRHGATHRTLVDNNLEEVKISQLQKLVNKVSRSANGNIGEALNNWALCIQRLDEENVRFELQQSYVMPDFINPDTGVVLSSIMMEKRTNEYRLRKLFGRAFEEKYKNIVQRLISVGLLVRHIDNYLEINELVVNEVGRLLEREDYIEFNV